MEGPRNRSEASSLFRGTHAKPSCAFIVSACLAGVNCTYRGKNKLKNKLKTLVAEHRAIAVCPEVMGGLGIPRENSEIQGGAGAEVLTGKAVVLTRSGKDVSANYVRGSRRILAIARKYGLRKAILKSKSPACGRGMIYDGTFSRTLKKGDGVLAALLRKNRIIVYTELDLAHAKNLKIAR